MEPCVRQNSLTLCSDIKTPVIIHIYSLEQSPSWEAKRFSASQQFPSILWNPTVHYRIHKCPPPAPTLSQINSSPFPQILLPGDQSQYYFFIYAWVSQVVSYPQVSPPIRCIRLFSAPFVLHAPPIPFFSILSPEQYWVSRPCKDKHINSNFSDSNIWIIVRKHNKFARNVLDLFHTTGVLISP